MTFRSLLLGALAAACLSAPAAAWADPAAPSAADLENQIRTWLAALFEPGIPLASRVVGVTQQGDAYQLSADIAGNYGRNATVDAGPVVARLRPLGGERWAVDELRIPTPMRLATQQPGTKAIQDVTGTVEAQSLAGFFDLSGQTTSVLDGWLRDYTLQSGSGGMHQTTRYDMFVNHMQAVPSGPGRLDVRAEGHGANMTINGVARDGTPFAVAAEGVDVALHAADVSAQKLWSLVHTGATLAGLSAVPDVPNGVPPVLRQPLRDLVLAIQDLASGVDERIDFRNVTAAAAPGSITAGRASFALGLAAPAGRESLRLSFSADRLDIPSLPAGPLHDDMPRDIAIAPSISGVPTTDIAHFLLDAIDSDGSNSDMLQAEALDLLAKGPLVIGIDELRLAAGPSTLTATGSVTVPAPDDVAGTVRIRMTGYDPLMQQAIGMPELRSALPILIFLKGIGTADGDAEVWNIDYRAGKLTVNGTDLSALLPSDAIPGSRTPGRAK